MKMLKIHENDNTIGIKHKQTQVHSAQKYQNKIYNMILLHLVRIYTRKQIAVLNITNSCCLMNWIFSSVKRYTRS